jgi:hypothetical protein
MSPVLAAVLSQSKHPGDCHPEAAEPLARERLPTKDLCTSLDGRRKNTGCPISRVLCEKWDRAR